MLRRLIRKFIIKFVDIYTEEQNSLVPRMKLEKAERALKWLREHVIEACPHSPTKCKKHYYCSNCWLSDIGPKMPGSERPPREISKVICPLRRSYGK